jgi:uroporphyrinogen decarboxylase
MLEHLPVKRPCPDATTFIDILMGRTKRARPPLVEYLVDDVVRKPIVEDLLDRQWVEPGGDRTQQRAYLDNFIAFWYHLGYDFVRFEQSLAFTKKSLLTADAAPASNKMRAWADEHQGAITNWEDFETYPWPEVEDTDMFAVEYIHDHLPEGMGLMTCHAGGIFEQVSQIMSLEGLSLALYDQRDLVEAVTQEVGQRMVAYYAQLCDLERVIALFQGDDMGFRTGTLIKPDDLRAIFLPWQKRFAAMAHERGVPYFLHSCGNLETIMEDLIDDVGIDGKHSYEDAIIPVEAFQAQYGDRIAVLGGMDLNILTAGTPVQVREHTRHLMTVCGARGRYAIGSGNSIPSYIPVQNYLAMVDEAQT